MKDLSAHLRKYMIMGSQNCKRNPVKILEEAVEGGITAFQFREKGSGSLRGKNKLELGKQLREVCLSNDVLFFVNDDLYLVDTLDADGIHVGQEDVSIDEIQKRHPDVLIGLSVSTDQELSQSPVELVDYIGAGPMFPTTTKETVKTPVGVEWIKTLRDRYPLLPIVGIGGITPDNAYSVIEAGANGVAVISAITKGRNIKNVIDKL